MIRILIVDDHRMFRFGLTRMLAEAKGMQIVGEAETGEEAILLARDLRPNVVLMDLCMPGIGGIEATRRIALMELDIKVIVVTACQENPFPMQALKAGAEGYLTKTTDASELVVAIKKVFLGKRYLSAEIAQLMAVNVLEDADACPFDQLSTREMQIMMMVVNCHKVGDISVNLHLSPKTVNSYRYRIFEKLNVGSDVELALMAVRHGMVSPETSNLDHAAAAR